MRVAVAVPKCLVGGRWCRVFCFAWVLLLGAGTLRRQADHLCVGGIESQQVHPAKLPAPGPLPAAALVRACPLSPACAPGCCGARRQVMGAQWRPRVPAAAHLFKAGVSF